MIRQLKRQIIYYLVSGVLLSLVIFGSIILNKYNDSRQETLNKLKRVKIKLSKMNTASHEIDILLSRIKTLIPPDFYASSTEEKIFTVLDDLKSRLNGAEVTIEDLEDKSEVVSLPVNIRGSLESYSGLVNNVGYLMALNSPFFTISDISLSRKQERDETVAIYVINGALQMPIKHP